MPLQCMNEFESTKFKRNDTLVCYTRLMQAVFHLLLINYLHINTSMLLTQIQTNLNGTCDTDKVSWWSNLHGERLLLRY